MKAALGFGSFAVVSSIVALGCQREPDRVVVPPPTVAFPSSATSGATEATKDVPFASRSPVTATFIDLTKTGAPIRLQECDEGIVSVAKGKARVDGDDLMPGDVIIVRNTPGFDVTGEGVALIAAARRHDCKPTPNPKLEKRVVRADAAPKLTWANGTMSAHLDVEKDASVYIGRLEGTASVAEHAHSGTWEILGAIEGAGTFTLNGEAKRLGSRQVVLVPPDTKHAWKPDEGTRLVAIQMYSPPGPEQRFRALAAPNPAPAPAPAQATHDAGSLKGAPDAGTSESKR